MKYGPVLIEYMQIPSSKRAVFHLFWFKLLRNILNFVTDFVPNFKVVLTDQKNIFFGHLKRCAIIVIKFL